MEINMKKVLKYIGNILTIIALIFIIKKILGMEFDVAIFAKPANWLILVTALLLYILNVMFICFPWVQLVEIFSSQKIPMKTAMIVYSKSNILKYVPGNVFQYVGRNELAVKMKVSHVDVACSTVIDTAISLFMAIILSVILMHSYLKQLFSLFGKNMIMTISIIIVLFLIIVFFLYFKFKDKFKLYLNKYVAALRENKKNVLKLLTCFLFYFIQNIVLSLLYMGLVVFIFEQEMDLINFANLIGAQIIANVIGFLTPGAPGGIGIRETVMTIIGGSFLDSDIILMSMVVYRMINVVADVLYFFVMKIVEKKTNKVA